MTNKGKELLSDYTGFGAETVPITETVETKAQPLSQPVLSQMVTPRRIAIWDYPVQKEAALRSLVETASKDIGTGDLEALFNQVMNPEEQGSTFFNEGVAFPLVHARY